MGDELLRILDEQVWDRGVNGKRTRNEGDKKFSMNQNLTLLFVCRRTLRIIIDAKRYTQTSVERHEKEGPVAYLVEMSRSDCEDVDLSLPVVDWNNRGLFSLL